MATCVFVLMPNARRESVKVTPNTSILQILEVACGRQKLDPLDFQLVHQRRSLDLSLSVRFANLPNNVLLEMRASERSRSESQITVCLQTEIGERLLQDFSSTNSLWDILNHWINLRGENVLRGETEHDAEPVCLYMRKEVVGENALKNTTLRSLGLTSGKVVIRLFYRLPESLKIQAHVESLKIPQPTEKLSANTDPAQNYIRETSNNITPQSAISNIENINSTEQASIPDCNQSSSSNQSILNADRTVDTQDVDMLDVQESEECTNKASEKFYDVPSTSEQPGQGSGSGLIPNEDPEVEVIYIGERDAVLYDAKYSSSLVTEDKIPDDFFELTVEDARYLYVTLQKQRKLVEDQTLTTSAYKTAKKLEKMLRFKHTILRIQFPDQLVLQAKFTPVEKVSCVKDFLQQFLLDESMDFYLFTTPPKEKLQPDLMLFEAELVPASLVHFGCQNQATQSILKPEVLALASSHKAACQAAANIRKDSKLSDGNSIEVICPSQPMQSTAASRVPREVQEPSSSHEGNANTSSSAKVPRWFQMGQFAAKSVNT